MRRLILAIVLSFPVATLDLQAAPRPGQNFGDWQVACERTKQGGQLCHIFQKLTLKKSGKLVLHVAVGHSLKGKPFALFVAPLGIALRPGVQLKVGGGKPHRMPVQVCTPRGCQASLALDKALIRELKRANTATFTFVRPDGKAFNVSISLKGFTKGFDSLRR